MKNLKSKIIAGIAVASIPASSIVSVYADGIIRIEIDSTNPAYIVRDSSVSQKVFRVQEGDTSFDYRNHLIAVDELGNNLIDQVVITKTEKLIDGKWFDTDAVDVNKKGEYRVTYNIEGHEDDPSSKSVITYLVVSKPAEPKIIGKGNVQGDPNRDEITVVKGSSINIMQYITAMGTVGIDSYENITKDVVTSGEVDTNTPGDYTITYDVKDNWETPAKTFTRTYHVVERKYTLHFNVDDRELAKCEANMGYSAGYIPPNAHKDGYKFIGWFLNETEQYDKNKVYDADTVFNAKFEKIPQQVVLTFKIDDNFYTSIKTTDVEAPNTTPTIPTKENFIFSKWVMEGNETEEYDSSKIYDKDTTFIAKFDPAESRQYKVIFIVDSKEYEVIKAMKESGAQKTPVAPTKKGYTFEGWKDKNGNNYDPEKSYNEDVVFKADFSKNKTYKVTFDPQNGEEKIIKEVEEKHPVGFNAPKLTLEGYVFKGWFIGDTPYSPNYVPSGDIIVHAKWEEEIKKVTIKFDYNNGSGEVFTCDIVSGKTVDKTINEPKWKGFKFLGWFDADGVKYTKDSKFTKDTTFYAKWEPLVDKEKEEKERKEKEEKERKEREEKERKEREEKERKEKEEKERKEKEDKKNKEEKEKEEKDKKAKEEKERKEKEEKERKEKERKNVEINVQNHTIMDVVGYKTTIFSDSDRDGLFFGTAKQDGRTYTLTYNNMRDFGISLDIPRGVSATGNYLTFNRPGSYDFVLTTNRGRTVTRVIIQEATKEKEIKAVTDKIEVFAGQSFNPMSFIDVRNGAKKSDVKIEYINIATGEKTKLNTGNVPFGKYRVIYTLDNGKTATLDLVSITAPSNTEGGKPSILVRDRIIIEQGKKTNLKEFAQAVDINGKNITDKIAVSGDVNWDKPGKYTVTFSVIDAAGKKSEKTTTIEVLEKTKYQAEISRTKGSGIKVKTSDDSKINDKSNAKAQAVILTSTALGLITLLVRKKH